MSWKGKPSNFALKVLQNSEQHVKRIAGDMLQAVVVGSPVDEGTFRGNHRVSIDTPDNSKDDTTDLQGGATIQKGQNVLRSPVLGKLVYIQNNLPYSVRLEDGYSKQAPDGVYRVAFNAVKEKYK